MPHDLDDLKDEELRKRLAKLMALRCFRNSELENLHAGVAPSSATGDYTVVKVVTPFGEIPWARLSRLNDDEMRSLMIDVVDRCFAFLTDLCSDPAGRRIIQKLRDRDPLPAWNQPKLDKS